MENNQPENSKIKLNFKDGKYATGKRKTSIAKVWLKKGTGKIFVNGKNFEDYFTRETHKMQILRPFELNSCRLRLLFSLHLQLCNFYQLQMQNLFQIFETPKQNNFF